MSEKRQRLSLPVIVALLGGTGTGKSSLINALLGQAAVKTGNRRPTTNNPVMICRPDLNPQEWGIDTSVIEILKSDSPALDRLVLLDCPDPDTTEDAALKETNLARLREAVPLCDVLLVCATQQKYRDHNVLDELARTAPGARLLFVQTHAAKDVDIREDWLRVLRQHYETGRIYFVDSRDALKAAEEGTPPAEANHAGDFADLHRLLTMELSEETALRIREANYVDRAEQVMSLCREDLKQHQEPMDRLKTEIEEERQKLGKNLTGKMQQELKNDRKLWETQLIQEVASGWWFSPFSIVLRVYLLIADIAAFFSSFRKLSPVGRAMGKLSDTITALTPDSLEKVNGLVCWNTIDLQKTALSLPAYLHQAGLSGELCSKEVLWNEANEAGRLFLAGLSEKVREVCSQLAKRRRTRMVRMVAEVILGIFLMTALCFSAKNFFYDIWTRETALLGLNHYAVLLIWFGILGTLLLGVFLFVIRRGLDGEIHTTVTALIREHVLDILFLDILKMLQAIDRFREELTVLSEQVKELNEVSSKLDRDLGHRKLG
jgi:hypothetical protein